MDIKKEKIIEYDALRVFVTLLVIIGHATYLTIISIYGGVDFSSLSSTGTGIIYELASKTSGLIYTFHMPLYMALSGALFNRSINIGGGVQ